MASGATCVQRLDDSRDSAIHTKYRILLRSSSMREPRYPLPRVVFCELNDHASPRTRDRGNGMALFRCIFLGVFHAGVRCWIGKAPLKTPPHAQDKGKGSRRPPIHREQSEGLTPRSALDRLLNNVFTGRSVDRFNNDPSAGSPTETLLRLLLPLNDKVQ